MRPIVKTCLLSVAITLAFLAWNRGGTLSLLSPWKVGSFALVQAMLFLAARSFIERRFLTSVGTRVATSLAVYCLVMFVAYDAFSAHYWNRLMEESRIYEAVSAPVAVTPENYTSFKWRRVRPGECGYIEIVELEFLDHDTVLESGRAIMRDRLFPLVYLSGDWRKIELERTLKRYTGKELVWITPPIENRSKLVLAGRRLVVSEYRSEFIPASAPKQ